MMLLIGTATVSAQIDRGIFNHLGIQAGVGTEGINVGLATPITDYLELGVGMNFMPGITFKTDVDVNDLSVQTAAGVVPIHMGQVNIKADFARTTTDVKLNCYPFGSNSSFFLAGGFSFGGAKIAEITGHSDAVMDAIRTYPEIRDQVFAEIDKYNVQFDDNGDVIGDIRVNSFRPYLGLGFGRLVPSSRVSARFELGCQFMGKMKVYQNDNEVNTNEFNDVDDDLSKIVDKLTVYPVLKFTLTGRIF